jgi:hypothetical protein
MRHDSLKWLKGAEIKELEGALAIWIGQVHTKRLEQNMMKLLRNK